jgi:DedD protein
MSLRDAERLKDKIEVSLDSRQIFFLFFGGAVVACLVFVLGVMVGRRLENREQVGQKTEQRGAVDPLAALDQLGADEAAARAQSGPGGVGLAFPSALGQKNAPKAGVGLAQVVPSEDDEDHAAAPAAKDVAKDGKVAGQAKAEAKPAEPKPEPKAAEPKAGETRPAEDGKQATAKKKKSKYTLQLSSFQSRDEAEAFAAKLTASGYKPFIVKSEVADKGTWYRVRLGGYDDHDEALAAKNEFERQERVIAYVTRL